MKRSEINKALKELEKTGLVKQGFVTTFAKETGVFY